MNIDKFNEGENRENNMFNSNQHDLNNIDHQKSPYSMNPMQNAQQRGPIPPRQGQTRTMNIPPFGPQQRGPIPPRQGQTRTMNIPPFGPQQRGPIPPRQGQTRTMNMQRTTSVANPQSFLRWVDWNLFLWFRKPWYAVIILCLIAISCVSGIVFPLISIFSDLENIPNLLVNLFATLICLYLLIGSSLMAIHITNVTLAKTMPQVIQKVEFLKLASVMLPFMFIAFMIMNTKIDNPNSKFSIWKSQKLISHQRARQASQFRNPAQTRTSTLQLTGTTTINNPFMQQSRQTNVAPEQGQDLNFNYQDSIQDNENE
ncbi:hypothetical protein [Mycoplasma sp. Mirounga ES2805-ORL]|uniref:hypothetical protein n=1 Tax=Mycoplasma sp. Mirounga ES2805-ORL TaxID=754514 RepID=UPI00197B98FB|nr:hypothetical protein [Mycoplasma sp. Mirounga ES2805-ORL]QSF13389.1 hypothetical protein JXZ90_01790 [Mycoplasma sp. Mirounga ES2805-ORL]